MTRAAPPTGLATAIGSLGSADPVAATELVFACLPELPAAPSLPNRDRHESILGQAGAGVAGVGVTADGNLAVDPERIDPDAPLADLGFSGPAWVSLRAFLVECVARRQRRAKFQLTGPVTFGLGLTRAGVDVDLAFALSGRAVAQRAEALLVLLADGAPLTEPMVFLDEPGLTVLNHPDPPISGDRATVLIAEAVDVLRDVSVGVHCCGPTDWSAVLDAGPDVLSVPIDLDLESHASRLARFLDQGGVVAWGAIAADEPPPADPVERRRRLGDQWSRLTALGCDSARLRTQALVTPACGLASFDPDQARRAMTLARELVATRPS